MKRTRSKNEAGEPNGRKRRSPLKKILPCALCIIAVSALIYFGYRLFITYRIVASIPDPEAFFGMSADIYKNIYTFEFEDDPSDAVQAYIDLLESSAYPFYLTREYEYNQETSYYLAYNGGKTYSDHSSNDIEVSYGNNYRGYDGLWLVSVTIRNSSNFELISAETYDWDGNAVLVAEQDTTGTSDTDTSATAAKETASAESSANSEQTTEQQTTGTTTISYNSNSVLLPDVGEFLRCGRGEDASYGSTGHFVSYSFSLDDGRDCIDEVIELFQNDCYQLTLYDITDANYISTSACLFSTYFFKYTGDNNAIEEVEDGYDARVMVAYYYGQGRIGITVYYDSDFEVIDPIVRAENQPTDYSGNPIDGSVTGSWDGTYIPEYATKDCLICHGTKECQTCGGDGYLWSSASGKEDRNCWRCQSHTGLCWACDGTGKIQY